MYCRLEKNRFCFARAGMVRGKKAATKPVGFDGSEPATRWELPLVRQDNIS